MIWNTIITIINFLFFILILYLSFYDFNIYDLISKVGLDYYNNSGIINEKLNLITYCNIALTKSLIVRELCKVRFDSITKKFEVKTRTKNYIVEDLRKILVLLSPNELYKL